MNDHPAARDRRSKKRGASPVPGIALTVAVCYALFAGLWETYADDLIASFIGSSAEIESLRLIKSLLFIGFTGIAVYVAARLTISRVYKADVRAISSEEEVLRRLGQAAEWRDDETGDHTLRVGEYCAAIASGLGWTQCRCEMVRKAGILHDVGKIGIPDSVMMKPGLFEDSDRKMMMAHTLLGADLLIGSDSPMLQMACRIAASHHERWDGKGYPYGHKGENIPIEGRIAAVADVFDALTSRRRYKQAWSFEKSVLEIESLACTHFDPAVVAAFGRSLGEIRIVYDRYKGTGRKLGVSRAA
ncbi:MAG: HD domain-containing protein [Armatimonadetes bacterium]|nr:HD domain-containing protein [Armatimonadota bacterium]